MNSRKKLIISLSSLGLAIVAAIGITFGVLAAQTQTVSNTFTVSYRANNVSAVAFVKYKLEASQDGYSYFVGGNTDVTVKTANGYSAAEINAMTDAQINTAYGTPATDAEGVAAVIAIEGNAEAIAEAYENTITGGTLTDSAEQYAALLVNAKKAALLADAVSTQSVRGQSFSAADATSSGTLTVDANTNTIALGSKTIEVNNEDTEYFDHYVIIAYGFTNTASAGGENMYVTLNDGSVQNATTKNVDIYYLVSSSYNASSETILASQDHVYVGASESVNTDKVIYTGAIAPGETKFVYVIVKIHDETLAADYASNSTHGVAWLLSNQNPEA